MGRFDCGPTLFQTSNFSYAEHNAVNYPNVFVNITGFVIGE